MAKTLVEFRAEKGLYLKDVASAIDISEEELSKIETFNGIPDYIVEKLIVAYNLPEDYFVGKKAEAQIKPIKNLKAYFFKTALLWEFVFALILSVPVSILVYITPFMTSVFGLTVTSFARNGLDFLADIITVVLTIVYCNMFAKHIMKKTGLSGDVYKYRYLYNVIPSGATAVVSVFSGLITTLALKETLADESLYYAIPIATGISAGISILSIVLVALVMASLLYTAVMEDKAQKAKQNKTMAIIVTISTVLAYVLTIYATTLEEYPTYDAVIRRIFVYGIYIAVAWLVCFVKDNDKKKEKLVFTILPLISIVDSVIFGVLDLFGF